jgi:CheY-like chemotaxis protein/nitrogen-specific signal transduction histidine kinase
VAERTARLEAALIEAEQGRAEADRATAAKSSFLAHMIHEIRTPLNGVLGLTELALRVADAPPRRRDRDLALQSGQTLLRVIDDVLEVSRLEAGALRLADEPFDLSDTLAEAVRSVWPVAQVQALSWRYDWLGERTWVRGDAARVRQIAVNLIGNAAKFTERGLISVVTHIDDGPDGRCQVKIDVTDTGPGIAQEQLGTLFDAFVQGDPSLVRRHGGTGLGLTISRALARAMGGDLMVASTLGEGSTFTLRLNMVAAPDPRPLSDPAPGLGWFVNPSAEVAEWLARRFVRMGWQTACQFSFEACLAEAGKLSGQPPQLVILAATMLTAHSDLEGLRERLPGTSIALLIRPDWHESAIESRALALGMTLQVAPLTPRDLKLLAATGLPAVAEPTAGAAAASHAGHVLLVEDNPINRLIGEEFLRALGVEARTANDGEQALAACAAEPPLLVLMDIQMPVMDGLEATRRMRALQREGALPAFPIVALTAHAMGGDLEQASAAGMDACVTKPILLDSLREALAKWLPALGGPSLSP